MNKEKCKREVEKWAEKKTFPKMSLPDGFLQTIVEVNHHAGLFITLISHILAHIYWVYLECLINP